MYIPWHNFYLASNLVTFLHFIFFGGAIYCAFFKQFFKQIIKFFVYVQLLKFVFKVNKQLLKKFKKLCTILIKKNLIFLKRKTTYFMLNILVLEKKDVYYNKVFLKLQIESSQK